MEQQQNSHMAKNIGSSVYVYKFGMIYFTKIVGVILTRPGYREFNYLVLTDSDGSYSHFSAEEVFFDKKECLESIPFKKVEI